MYVTGLYVLLCLGFSREFYTWARLTAVSCKCFDFGRLYAANDCYKTIDFGLERASELAIFFLVMLLYS